MWLAKPTGILILELCNSIGAGGRGASASGASGAFAGDDGGGLGAIWLPSSSVVATMGEKETNSTVQTRGKQRQTDTTERVVWLRAGVAGGSGGGGGGGRGWCRWWCFFFTLPQQAKAH